ncbi:MAG: glycosyltransferase [Planctomycetia bacterium]|nr:MAG: glycosyltransferase [Planctomycetia bacterium]
MDGLLLGRAILAAYVAVLSLLCVYGLHRCFLVALYYRHRRKPVLPAGQFVDLPAITVQLPMYNEASVAARVIEAAGRIEYPRDRFEIQVLDDSTDNTSEIAAESARRLRAAGITAHHVRRSSRVGYKAGALQHGLTSARGELVAIFDADFVPPPRILLDSVAHFTDARVGAVQCRWDHLNRDDSVLTRAQSILLDGHFIVEHVARNRSGRFMSFNGTAGIWRRAAIDDAGGWQHDTLTEDLDLSYRAQLRGWRFVFLPNVTSPAELPPEMNAFKAQQHRWTKGGAQTCVKLLATVLRSRLPLRVKVEAFFHLTGNLVYVLMVLLALLLGPAILARASMDAPMPAWQMAVEWVLFLVGTGSALMFYVVSQREIGRGMLGTLAAIPSLMALGVGIAFNNALAALDGLIRPAGEFVRTPKFGRTAGKGEASGTGGVGGEPAAARDKPTRATPRPRPNPPSAGQVRGRWQAWAELGMAAYLTVFVVCALLTDGWAARVSAVLPFLAIFVGGYVYVAVQTLAPRALGGIPAA